MSPSPDHPSEAELVEWLDGELSASEAARVHQLVDRDADLAERVRLLRSTRNELVWALQESETTPPPAPLAEAPRRKLALGKWLLAAAALAIVVAIGNWQPVEKAYAAENELLAVTLKSPQSGWDLFSNIRFSIDGRAKTDVPCRIMARGKDETDEQMAARALKDNHGKPVVPMVMSAALTIGKQQIVGDIFKTDGVFTKQGKPIAFRLVDVRTRYDGIGPLLALKPGEDGGSEDFTWCYRNGVTPHQEGLIGFVPTDVGEYQMSVQLRALPATANSAPAFTKPLEVAIGFAVRGVVGEWSEPVDGLSARFLSSRPTTGNKRLAIGVQVRNNSKIPRRYSVTGATIAKIPQPLHFDLLVDGEQWEQRDGLAVIHMARSSFLPQPVGTSRAMIVLADYWHQKELRPKDLRGKHKLGIRFHYSPSVWDTNDKSIWVGMIDTPPVEIAFQPEK